MNTPIKAATAIDIVLAPAAILLTTHEAAAQLSVTHWAVRKAIERGYVRATKHGRDWFVTQAECDRYGAERGPAAGRLRKVPAAE